MKSRREIAQQRRRPAEPLCTGEWGDALFVRRMGARKKLELEDWTSKTDGMKDSEKALDGIVKFVIFSVVEESGEAAFKAEDLDWLKEEDEAVLMAVFKQALAANGMRPEDLEDAKKNSAPSPTADSSASSAEPSITAG